MAMPLPVPAAPLKGRIATVLAAALGAALLAQVPAAPWTSDRGDGTYRNPILYADYSDPDAIRVGDDFYMIASSFTAVPGVPILHSRDLVNWTLIGHALPRLVPEDVFAAPQHGGGVWAPALRHHAGRFWIYYPDPDRGIYVTTAADPKGQWSRPVLVKGGKGLIDPCPLWDDDGRVYLVHAWARSRAGFANVVTLVELSRDGTRALDQGRIIIDGNRLTGYTTLEGPKLYRREGWYYVFAPAGGVKQGWQSVFRSRRVDGPYEGRIVLAQGTSDINGPHQGALVDTAGGASWFIHFQDLDAYGRVVHLQPVTWRDGWPIIGRDDDGDGTGEPVRSFRKPDVGREYPVAAPQASDEFDSASLGLQWQWQANPAAAWSTLTRPKGRLRLLATPSSGTNLWSAPHLLLQKLPGPAFTATTTLEFAGATEGERAGLLVFGTDYAWLGVRSTREGLRLVAVTARGAIDGAPEQDAASLSLDRNIVYLRATVEGGAIVQFSYSYDNLAFAAIGSPFTARPGRWVGAKIGLFAAGVPGNRHGAALFDWFRIAGRD
jgi:beta-xylosidase